MNTDALVAHARARFDHAAARRVLKEKYEAKMVFAHAGGMWRAGPELLTTLLACAQDKEVVILDLYETPVQITVTDLFAQAHERWQEQMNAWKVEWQELNKKR
jgi:hypothetical protein